MARFFLGHLLEYLGRTRMARREVLGKAHLNAATGESHVQDFSTPYSTSGDPSLMRRSFQRDADVPAEAANAQSPPEKSAAK
jgi:hypothetical protein